MGKHFPVTYIMILLIYYKMDGVLVQCKIKLVCIFIIMGAHFSNICTDSTNIVELSFKGTV